MTVLDLPFPPSVNRIWRMRKGGGKPYLDTRYQTWKRVADNLYLANKRNWLPVKGNFRATITLDIAHRGRTDLDNRIKALLDWLQRAKIIENDSLCDGLNVKWGRAPDGCRVELRPTRTQHVGEAA